MASRPPKSLGSNSEHTLTASSPVAPPTARAARKRPRESVIADEMEIGDHAGGTRAKKSKKATSTQIGALNQPCPSIVPLAGPSSNPTRTSSNRVPTLVTDAAFEVTPIDLAETSITLVSDSNENGANDPEVEISRLHREIAQLKEQLGLQVKNQEAAKLQTIQRMMLDKLREQNDNEKRLDKLRRQKCHAMQYAKQQQADCEKQKKKLDESSKKHGITMAELTYYKDETEHLQSLNKAMEEDLDELRRIDNEERSQRLHNKQELPPAYGSLDDDDPSPLPLLHLDGGGFDVAALKRTVSKDFAVKVREAQMNAHALRDSSVEASAADRDSFVQMSLALGDSSRVLKAALDQAATVSVKTTKANAETSNPQRLSKIRPMGDTSQVVAWRTAGRAFVAERIAKLLLSLAWRVVSATELRPVSVTFSPRNRALLCLSYKEVDDCFHEALRHTFILSKSEEAYSGGTLWDCQYYLTQISALRRSFEHLAAGLSYSLFTKSFEWLSEVTEGDRRDRANEELQGGAQMDTAVFQEHSAGSEVSSEMSNAESSSSSAVV